jgi:glycosyltransferase involved in cell wall biosynthesis
MAQQRITAALIVKDEAEFLRDCLTSIAHVVDEIVVVDTGSTDTSAEVAASFGAMVLHRPWDGRFAPPRNLGLDHATGDWILYIDADEVLRSVPATEFRSMLDHAAANGVVALQVLFFPKIGATPYYEWRLWRHRPDVRFEGVMHEGITTALGRVLSEPGAKPARTAVCTLEHHGYEGNQHAKNLRNLPLLRAELERTPERTYLWNHLGRVLEALGQHDEAHAAWDRAIEIVRTRGPEGPLDGMSYADVVLRRVHERLPVADLLDEALRWFPDNGHLRWSAALDAHERGSHKEALVHTQVLTTATADDILASGLSYSERLYTDWAHHLEGLCHFELGAYDRAAASFERAVAFAPTIPDYRVKLALARSRAQAT